MRNIRLIFRWTIFLLAALYCLRMLFFGDWSSFGGPFRYLTIWALFCSFFAASRMMALEEDRSEARWDGFVAMTAVLNTMVVVLYWRLYFADPHSVTQDGSLGEPYLEIYLHGVGPFLQVIDSLFVHRSHRRMMRALMWLAGVIGAFILWSEFVLQRFNEIPAGTVTSGLPYRFLNDLTFADRANFYATNVAVGVVLLFVYAGITWLIRRSSLPHKAP